MALARVVSFEGVDQARVDEMKSRIGEGPPDDVPASEVVMLYDAAEEKALVVLFFEDEDSYARGDATLSAMPADETPGRRTAISKFEVAVRQTA